jgi:hypothetical protein
VRARTFSQVYFFFLQIFAQVVEIERKRKRKEKERERE